jgi:hypothetical protein
VLHVASEFIVEYLVTPANSESTSAAVTRRGGGKRRRRDAVPRLNGNQSIAAAQGGRSKC